jgi:hypothetical protein
MEPSKGNPMKCPHCKSPARDDWPCEFRCGSITHSGGEFYRSNRCFNNEIAQLKAKVACIEAAGDKLAAHHLLVPTTYPQAQAHVAEYRKEKEQS